MEKGIKGIMKAYKVVLKVVDSDELGKEQIIDILENTKFVYPTVMEITEREIGEWHDEHPLNYVNCFEAFEETFK